MKRASRGRGVRLKAMNKLALAIATWFGCGYAPWAPGTVGSAGGVLVGWLLVRYAGWPPWTLAVLAAVLTPVGIWAAGRTAAGSAPSPASPAT